MSKHSLKVRELTHHPRKRTFSPEENFGRSERRANFDGSGPFWVPAMLRGSISAWEKHEIDGKV